MPEIAEAQALLAALADSEEVKTAEAQRHFLVADAVLKNQSAEAKVFG